jgi:uncharacterized protein with HEPN domain
LFIDDATRLAHMRDAAEEVRGFVAAHGREDIDSDVFLARGLIRTLETIGEAATRTTRNFRDAHPRLAGTIGFRSAITSLTTITRTTLIAYGKSQMRTSSR